MLKEVRERTTSELRGEDKVVATQLSRVLKEHSA